MRCLLVVVLLAACGRDAPREPRLDPTKPARVVFGDVPVTVEVVATREAIDRGMMHRAQLAADAGMLFLMGREHDWAFWMKDTMIPLDLIFITKDLRVAGVIPRMPARSERPRRLGTKSLYVVEVNSGWAATHGVGAGTAVRFENIRL